MGIFDQVKEINLPLDIIKKIVKEHIEKDTKREVNDVEFSIGTRWEGYGTNEHSASYIQDVKVTFK